MLFLEPKVGGLCRQQRHRQTSQPRQERRRPIIRNAEINVCHKLRGWVRSIGWLGRGALNASILQTTLEVMATPKKRPTLQLFVGVLRLRGLGFHRHWINLQHLGNSHLLGISILAGEEHGMNKPV